MTDSRMNRMNQNGAEHSIQITTSKSMDGHCTVIFKYMLR